MPRDIQKILDGSGAAVQGTLELTLGGVLDKLAGWITDEPFRCLNGMMIFVHISYVVC